jgi:hypothetical protein
MVKDIEGVKGKVQVQDVNGDSFWIPIIQANELPLIIVNLPTEKALCTNYVGPKKIDLSKATTQEKTDFLLQFHMRHAHSTGNKLYLTLKEKGLGGLFTVKECQATSCDACRILNRKSTKIPPVMDTKRDNFAAGEVAYQDLIVDMPKDVGGFQHAYPDNSGCPL